MPVNATCLKAKPDQLYTLEDGLIRPVLTAEDLAYTIRTYRNNPVCVMQSGLIVPGGKSSAPDYRLRTMFLFRVIETDRGSALFQMQLERNQSLRWAWDCPTPQRLGSCLSPADAIKQHKQQTKELESQGLVTVFMSCNLFDQEANMTPSGRF